MTRQPHPPTEVGQSFANFTAFNGAIADRIDLGFCWRQGCGICRSAIEAEHQPASSHFAVVPRGHTITVPRNETQRQTQRKHSSLGYLSPSPFEAVVKS